MAVRNLSGIQSKGAQYKAEQKNKAEVRMARVRFAMQKIDDERENIVDAIDTMRAMRGKGMDKELDAICPSLGRAGKISIHWGDKMVRGGV